MSKKIDMSLDDTVERNTSQFKRPGLNRGPRGGRTRDRRIPREEFGPTGTKQVRGRNRRLPNTKPKESPERWQHDLFEQTTPRSRKSSGVTKVVISNLDYGVSDNDMKTLFEEYGTLRKAAIHYDRSGRSLGRAVVVFQRRGDAVKAMKQYNNVPLDGRRMRIRIASPIRPGSLRNRGSRANPVSGRRPGSPARPGSGKRRGSPARPGSGRRRGSPARPGRRSSDQSRRSHPGSGSGRSQGQGSASRPFLSRDRGAYRGRSRREHQHKLPSAKQLDAELDAYMNQGKDAPDTVETM